MSWNLVNVPGAVKCHGHLVDGLRLTGRWWRGLGGVTYLELSNVMDLVIGCALRGGGRNEWEVAHTWSCYLSWTSWMGWALRGGGGENWRWDIPGAVQCHGPRG